MSPASNPVPSGEAPGFTLIELLIAISILGLIATAVVGLILTSMRTTSETRERLNDTGAYMITSGYFGPDVQGANQVTANNQPGFPTGTAPPGCGPSEDTLVVQLSGTDFADVTTARDRTISYSLTDAGRTLMRHSCISGDPDAQTDLVMAEGLDPGRPPSVSCRDGSGTAVTCSSDSTGLVSMTLTTARGVTESLVGMRRTS